jgi:hypothetical protein
MKRYAILIMLIAAMFLAACSGAAATTAAEEPTAAAAVEKVPTTKAADSQAYPAADPTNAAALQSDVSAYPAPQGETSTAATYGPDTKTGVEAVDRILTALFAGNLPGVVSFVAAPCTKAEGMGGPPKCRGGEEENSQVEGIPLMGPEGSYIRKDETPQGFLTGAYMLLAVYEVKADAAQEAYYPVGKYGILLSQDNTSGSPVYVTLRVDDSGIVRVDTNLDVPGSEFKDAAKFLLPLK